MLDSRCLRVLACVLCTSIIITFIPQSLGKTVRADTTISYAGENPTSDCSYRSVEEASFTAEVKTTNKWSGHSNIEIKFKNTGTETIHDWYFTFDFNYKIENPFNCRVIESKDNLYTIGNNDWNQDIKPGESVTVGFTAASKDGSDIKDMPTFYLLNTETVALKSGDLTYKYEEYSNWSSGFNGALILTNKTKETIRDWTITFSANRPITQVDSSVFTDNTDGTYTITNDGSNQNIAKGQTYRLGIQGGANDPSKAFAIADFTATAKKMALKLTDDKDKNGIMDVLEVDFNGAITVTPTETPTSTPTATNTPSATATPTATNTPTVTPSATSKPTATSTPTVTPSATTKPTVTNTPTSTNKPTSTPTATSTPTMKPTISATPTTKPTMTSTPTATSSPKATPKPTISATPTPTISNTPTTTATISATPTVTITVTPTNTAAPTGISYDIDYSKDTDKDGLPDDLEDYYGTNKNKADTDGDGVNDLYEIMLETDPLTKDSSGSNDFDNDGLTNAKESQLGTDPRNRDTDLDGLTDGAEVNLHGTDPKKYDTDDDGISDAGELSLGSNPNKKDSDTLRYQTLEFYPKANSKLNGVTKVEVGGYISGYIEENTTIKDISDEDPHSASIDALVGVPVSVETTGNFTNMYIKFYYEEGDFEEDDLRVLWYDEASCRYVVIDVEDSRINYGENYFYIYTDHFSKYMLIDQGAWVKSWSSGMQEAGSTSALRNNYTLAGYKWDMEQLLDSDKDGLPNVLETNGMITNIGTVVRTDPNNPDTDGDGLSDGYEMGDIHLTEDAFELGTFQHFVRYWYAEHGMRPYEWVFFCMRSNPSLSDSDDDGASDGIDKTPNDKNEPINYILVDPGDEYRLITARAYETYFNRHHMKSHAIPLNNSAHFQQFFEYLEYDFERIDGPEKEDLVHCSEIQYSRVDNIIICTHGGIDDKGAFIQGHTGNIYANDIASLLVNCSSIEIKTIDLLVCYGGYYDSKTKSVAVELLKATHAEAVYGSTTSISFLNIGSGRECFLFNVVLDDGGYYKHYYNDKNQLIRKGHLWIFGVMVRITDKDHVPFNVIDDYPDT